MATSSEHEDESRVHHEIDRLVDEYRSRCLWFLREDFYPRTTEERLRTLVQIEKHADVQGFKRAGTLKRWFSRRSSETCSDG